MGKRKGFTHQAVKKRALDTHFNCPFCNHAGSVTCRLDQEREVGCVSCGSCGRSYASKITRLDVPVDVYHGWIDACEEADDKRQAELAAAQACRAAAAAAARENVAAAHGAASLHQDVGSRERQQAGARLRLARRGARAAGSGGVGGAEDRAGISRQQSLGDEWEDWVASRPASAEGAAAAADSE